MPWSNVQHWGVSPWSSSKVKWSDTIGDFVKIIAPANNSYTNQNPVDVIWTVDGVVQVTETTEILIEGANIITRQALDGYGITQTASVNVTLDTIAPTVSIISPADTSTISTNPASVVWTIDGITQTSQLTEVLIEGANTITRQSTDLAGNIGIDSVSITLDSIAPTVVIVSPVTNTYVNSTPATIVWTVDGVTQGSQNSEDLVEGENIVTRQSSDAVGNIGSDSIIINLDTVAPTVSIISPADASTISTNPAPVVWTVDGITQTSQLTEVLIEGANTITRTSTDLAGNIGIDTVSITLDTIAPTVVIVSPVDGSTLTSTPATVVWTVDSITQGSQNSEDLTEGTNVITRQASDAVGNIGTDSVTVTYAPSSGFVPTDDASLIAWFDTDNDSTITQVSGEVSDITDYSSTYTLSQATGSDQPDWNFTLNGKKTFTYDGGDDMAGTISHSGTFQYIMLFYVSAVTGSEQGLFAFQDFRAVDFVSGNSSQFDGLLRCYNIGSSNISCTNGPFDTAVHLFRLIMDRGTNTIKIYIDSVLEGTDTNYTTTLNATAFKLMSDRGTFNELTGRHGDICITSDLSDSTYNDYVSFYNTKWGTSFPTI